MKNAFFSLFVPQVLGGGMEFFMETYGEFARTYDFFMDHVPYEKWHTRIKEKLLSLNIDSGIMVDLGCGTGTITRMFRDDGFDMIGIDSSYSMLSQASAKEAEEKNKKESDLNFLNILYLNQDIREFELYGTARAFISTADVMNYMTTSKDFLNVLKLVNNYLDYPGVFIFDLKTERFFKDMSNGRAYVDNRDDKFLAWEDTYYENERINEINITIFEKRKDDCYKKITETHVQRAYSEDEIKKLVNSSGLILEGIYKEDIKTHACGDLERVYVVCEKR